IGPAVIHGFDDEGRKSDGDGLLRDWWTAEDARQFEAEAAKLGAQYESYEFPQLPDMHINGKVAMGENIGDLGGLTIALEAYRRSLDGKPAPVIDGFTGEQRFFMGWAQVWRTLWRDDALRQQLGNGTHSPGHSRAFPPLRNTDAWSDAFEGTERHALCIAHAGRVRLWQAGIPCGHDSRHGLRSIAARRPGVATGRRGAARRAAGRRQRQARPAHRCTGARRPHRTHRPARCRGRARPARGRGKRARPRAR